MSRTRLLAFSGSARRESLNQKLVQVAAAGARSAGADVTVVNLRQLPMPLYDQDLEAAEGLPEHARSFKQLLLDHHGLLIASPEYNGSITPLLKNSIDWASRAEAGDDGHSIAFRAKVAALMSASPGRLGGLRGLVHVRSILHGLGVMVLPKQVTVGQAFQALAEDGSLADPDLRQKVEDLGRQLAQLAARMRA